MADEEHLAVLRQGVAAWNAWRNANPYIHPNLTGANLREANLREADFTEARLNEADLSQANLSEANLEGAVLVDTNFTGADLTGCRVYGISAWDVKLDGAMQKDLIITPPGEPEITVDNLEDDVLRKPWCTQLIRYQDLDDIRTNLDDMLIRIAEAKVLELRGVSPSTE